MRLISVYWQAQISDIQDAWSGLWRQPLRSLLSSIGIAIGVAALVAMLSIGEGGRRQAVAQIASLGMNTIRIENAFGSLSDQDISMANISQGLNMSDADRIAGWIDNLGEVAAFRRQDDVLLAHREHTLSGTVLGVDPAWFVAEELVLAQGRLLFEADLLGREQVCVAGSAVLPHLQIELDDTLRMGNHGCRLVGWLHPRGRLLTEGTGLSALDFDRSIFLPRTSFPYTTASPSIDGLIVRLIGRPNEASIHTLAHQLDALLLQAHQGIRDFRMVVPLTLMKEVRDTQRLFGLVMGAIAGLSLIVGGIGIMNVMLANIAEQTREIGLRMAVGASHYRIISLYLWHAVLLTATGGSAGSLLGLLIALAIQMQAGWPIALLSGALLWGPLFAVLSGLLFGLHPAMRAASLQPAQALREA